MYGWIVSLLLRICCLIYARKKIMAFSVQVFMKLTVSSIMWRSHTRFHPYWTMNVKSMDSNYFMPPVSYNYGESSGFCSNWSRKVESMCRIDLCSEGENAHHWDILTKLVLAQQFLYKTHTMNCTKIHQMVSSLMCWVTTNGWTWSLYESFFFYFVRNS